MQNADNPLLHVKNMEVTFSNTEGLLYAVDDVSWELHSGEVIGLVGESGCGKSVSALTLAGLLEIDGLKTKGEALFEGKNLLNLNFQEMSKIRGTQIGFVFQDPMSSLNPMLPIWKQISEVAVYHKIIPRSEAKNFAIEWMKKVGIQDAHLRCSDFPHQFSGGMRQRVVIAMAMSCHPKLLICDEPTTALDVTVEKQIMDLILQMRDEHNIGILLITHNLAMALNRCDRLLVMHGGMIMEQGSAYDILRRPMHNYTQHLFNTNLAVGRSEQIVKSAENFRQGCLYISHEDTEYTWASRNQIQQVPGEQGHFVNQYRNNQSGIA